MLLNLTEYSIKTIQDQVYDQILGKIIHAELNPGDELEPVGLLAKEHHINKRTIQRVYEQLEEKDIIEYKNEVGYYIKSFDKEDIEKFRSELEQREISKYNSEMLNNIYKEAAAKHKIEEELKVARQIQSDLLPKQSIIDDYVEITGYTKPSQVVCGDFYDYFRIDENRYGLVIADASGKGMPAAILISQIQAILKSEIGNGSNIPAIMNKLNNHLVKNSSARNFTSLFYGILDCSSGQFEYANAGHNFPILINESKPFELLKTTGPALGLVNEFEYGTQTINITNGARILFYTDGITETMNEIGGQFGEGRLIELMVRNSSISITRLLKEIETKVGEFQSDNFINDDKTLMAVKITKLNKNNYHSSANDEIRNNR